MNVIDSSCWLESFADNPGAERFVAAVQDIPKLIVPSVTLYEVFRHILRERGNDDACRATGYMRQGQVIDLTAEIALSAARLGHQLKLPVADAIILATAMEYDATLWTQDEHFQGIQGVKYFEKITEG